MPRAIRMALRHTIAIAFLIPTAGIAGIQPETALNISGADDALTRQTHAILSEAQAELVARSGVVFQDTVYVVYVAAEQSFDSVLGGRFPDWGVAAAVAERNLIAVRSPADFPLGRSLAEILRHELAHLHLDQIAGLRSLPRWMHEGYAQHFAHEWRFGDDWTVARAVFTGRVLPLRDVDGVNSFQSVSARLAYAQSYLAMSHFLQAYGAEGLILFGERVRAGDDWDDALNAAIGADYAAFQIEFTAFLTAKYNWAAFLGDTILLWIAIVAAFLVLYLIKRYRTGRKKKEWERQEAIEDILYSPFRGTGDPPPDPEP